MKNEMKVERGLPVSPKPQRPRVRWSMLLTMAPHESFVTEYENRYAVYRFAYRHNIKVTQRPCSTRDFPTGIRTWKLGQRSE